MSNFGVSPGPYISRIQTEYGDLLLKSPYSVRMREYTDQKNLRTIAVIASIKFEFSNYSIYHLQPRNLSPSALDIC